MTLNLAVMNETKAFGEKRVALVPEVVAKILKKWPETKIVVEAGAGEAAGYVDDLYKNAGAEISGAGKGLSGADVVLRVSALGVKDGKPALSSGGVMVALSGGADAAAALTEKGFKVMALEKLPRTSRAQAMDVLSSQANLGGYAAVLGAVRYLPRLMPMMTTAAGSAKPANVLVLGVGVAGLQAIATAKRLGAVVWAFDVRPEVAEQIKSLGGKVVEVDGPSVEGKGGYAGAMDAAGMKQLQEKLLPFVAAADVVISTAQVPGKPAPVLISADAVKAMKAGSVIVDLGAGGYNKANAVKGGNCPLTVADAETQTANGVTLLGETNWPATVAGDASRFWAMNMFNLLSIWRDKDGTLVWDDELVAAMTVSAKG